jgi:hypothetical protein
MTRGKPLILSRKPGSTIREDRKREAEDAFRANDLPNSPPPELYGMHVAQKTWRQLMKANSELPDNIFNGLDKGFLINYCQAVEAKQRALDLEDECRQRFERGELELENLLKTRIELRMATRLVADLEKQLYATPKSRAGVNPRARELTTEELISRELSDLDFLGD